MCLSETEDGKHSYQVNSKTKVILFSGVKAKNGGEFSITKSLDISDKQCASVSVAGRHLQQIWIVSTNILKNALLIKLKS